MFGKIFHFKKKTPVIYAAIAKAPGTFEFNGNVIGYEENDVVFFDGPGPKAKPIDMADNGPKFVATHEASILIPVKAKPAAKKEKPPATKQPKAPSKPTEKKTAAKAKPAAKKKGN